MPLWLHSGPLQSPRPITLSALAEKHRRTGVQGWEPRKLLRLLDKELMRKSPADGFVTSAFVPGQRLREGGNRTHEFDTAAAVAKLRSYGNRTKAPSGRNLRLYLPVDFMTRFDPPPCRPPRNRSDSM